MYGIVHTEYITQSISLFWTLLCVFVLLEITTLRKQTRLFTSWLKFRTGKFFVFGRLKNRPEKTAIKIFNRISLTLFSSFYYQHLGIAKENSTYQGFLYGWISFARCLH